jgi:GR25 family glycosyltransferase involved in LPS biosynthesis
MDSDRGLPPLPGEGAPSGTDLSADRLATPPDGLQRVAVALGELLGQEWAEIAGAVDRWAAQVSAQTRALEATLSVAPASPQPSATPPVRTAPAAAPPPAPHPASPAPALSCEVIATFDLAASWTGWSFHQSVRMRPEGRVELAQDRSTPGVVSDPIALPAGGLYRLSVDLHAPASDAATRLHLRALDAGADGRAGEALGPDMPLAAASECFIFVPHRIARLRIFIVAFNPAVGFSFQLRRVTLEHVDAESCHRRRRHAAAAPVIASMASVPSRVRMLRDTVESLLAQCDVVRVFLNGYPDVPEFLRHPRVEVRRSQDWDDKGDAGKFGWIDAPDPPGYRVIVDDDMLFPPDFTERMIQTLASYGNRAIAAAHGVLLKQPLLHYYDPASRSVQHFQNHQGEDATVHVLGTNAMMFHSACVTLRWDDFMYRNMADIFLARFAQREGIPMISVRRPRAWVRQNTQAGGFETIYENSLKQTRSRFDSSAVQDALVRAIAPLTLQPTQRPKIAVLLLATEAASFDAAVDSWRQTRWAIFDWVLIVVAATEDAALADHVARATVACELHIVGSAAMSAVARLDAAFDLLRGLRVRFACVATDAVRFAHGGWTRPLAGRFGGKSPGYLFAEPGPEGGLRFGGWEQTVLPGIAFLDGRLLSAPGSQPADTVAARLAQHLRGQLANGRLVDVAEDAARLGTMLGLADVAAARAALARPSAPVLPAPRRVAAELPPLSVNDLFARVVVINLDRRPDRLAQVQTGLARAGIRAERFAAIDRERPDVAAEYAAYCATPLAEVGEGVRPIRFSRDFYFSYDSQRARVAYLESQLGRHAIETAGAWAYLRSWEAILEQALADRVPALLVLDDDVVLHRQAPALFAAAVAGLPADWMILQLGTLQYHWTEDWITRRTPFLYSTNGSAIGSHAVGVRFEALPFLLDHVKRMELPFDTGALSAATRAFADRSFVISPNVAIQRLADSDIGSSAFQKGKTLADMAAAYRWALEEYEW